VMIVVYNHKMAPQMIVVEEEKGYSIDVLLKLFLMMKMESVVHSVMMVLK